MPSYGSCRSCDERSQLYTGNCCLPCYRLALRSDPPLDDLSTNRGDTHRWHCIRCGKRSFATFINQNEADQWLSVHQTLCRPIPRRSLSTS